MACEICGYSYSYSSHSCPECAKRRTQVNPMVKEHVAAGQNFGEAVIKIFMAFFLHPYICLIGFSAMGLFALLMIAPYLGLSAHVEQPWDNPPGTAEKIWKYVPAWYLVVAVGVPALVAVFFRKYVRPFMKWIFIIGISALVIWAVIALGLHLKNR